MKLKLFKNLNQVKKNICSELTSAVNHKDNREISLATSEKNIPSLRIVILRKFTSDFKLHIFTDLRSKKSEQMIENKNVSVLYYNRFEKIQIRLNGTSKIFNKKITWENLSENSKINYNTKLPPGTQLNSNIISYNKKMDIGIKNFAIYKITIQHIDWLKLAYQKSSRARFKVIRDKKEIKLEGAWLVP